MTGDNYFVKLAGISLFTKIGGNMKTYFGKRLFDLVVASGCLLVLLPLLIIISCLVLIFSGRPIFYRQARNGLFGKKFYIYKFRTMYNGAHEQIEQLLVNTTQHSYCHRLKEDPRVTKIGRILRRWNLDELPQLVNIIRGEMSLVGPRPGEDYFSTDLKYRYQVDRLRPGLTGYYQIFSHTTDISDVSIRIKLIDRYWQEISFLTDIKIILLTFKVIWKQKF